jgi:rubrerythrin
MSSVFKRTIEDFTCGYCGANVTGTGFTNHCPACLWSKHVDITPGDRASKCNGLMEPILIEIEKEKTKITHRCIVCGYEKRNKTADNDSEDEIVRIMGNH